jgi:hypothetical protein
MTTFPAGALKVAGLKMSWVIDAWVLMMVVVEVDGGGAALVVVGVVLIGKVVIGAAAVVVIADVWTLMVVFDATLDELLEPPHALRTGARAIAVIAAQAT